MMTRKQNAMVDRKYKKVITKDNYTYLDRLSQALHVSERLYSVPPIMKKRAERLAKGEK